MTGQGLWAGAGGLLSRLAALSGLPGTVLGFLLGLVAGSFLGALITRWPRGESVLAGRSRCDACGRTLRAVDLVPLLSAWLSRGRCRRCGARIDPAHGAMELGCGAIGAAAMALTPLPPLPVALGWMLLGWLLLALALLDARHYWLPDALTLPLAFLGLSIGPWVTGVSLGDAAIGAAAGYGALLLVALGYRAARGREGLGLGDAKLLGALGAWFGWQALPFILLLASLAGLLWVVAGLLRGKSVDGGARVAFGTFLCLAALPGGMAFPLLLTMR